MISDSNMDNGMRIALLQAAETLTAGRREGAAARLILKLGSGVKAKSRPSGESIPLKSVYPMAHGLGMRPASQSDTCASHPRNNQPGAKAEAKGETIPQRFVRGRLQSCQYHIGKTGTTSSWDQPRRILTSSSLLSLFTLKATFSVTPCRTTRTLRRGMSLESR